MSIKIIRNKTTKKATKNTSNKRTTSSLPLSQSTIDAMDEYFRTLKGEHIMMLGSSSDTEIDICTPVKTKLSTETNCILDEDDANRILQEWRSKNWSFKGFAHSHPEGYNVLSPTDVEYSDDAMEKMGMSSFRMPIYMRLSSGDAVIYDFTVHKDKKFTGEPEATFIIPRKYNLNTEVIESMIYQRIDKEFSPDQLRNKTVIMVGCGGASGIADILVRCGITSFVLIDGDRVSASNIAGQDFELHDTQEFKVNVAAKHLKAINPACKVRTHNIFLSDDIDVDSFVELFGDDILKNPEDVVILACTDQFRTQDALLTIAEKLGIPYVAPQMYALGNVAEITFYYPGVTPVSPREILHSRYKAYADGFINNVTSEGAIYPTTVQANAMTAQVALMALLYHEKGTRFYHLIDRVKYQNLVLIRMYPDAGKEYGLDYLDEAMNPLFSFFGEAHWVPVIKESICDSVAEIKTEVVA